MKNSQINNNITRSGIRTVLLKTGSIITILISIASAFLITQTPPGSHSRIGTILTVIVSALVFLSFFQQLRQNKPSDNTDNTQ